MDAVLSVDKLSLAVVAAHACEHARWHGSLRKVDRLFSSQRCIAAQGLIPLVHLHLHAAVMQIARERKLQHCVVVDSESHTELDVSALLHVVVLDLDDSFFVLTQKFKFQTAFRVLFTHYFHFDNVDERIATFSS